MIRWISDWFARCAAWRRQRAALQLYGWDGQCPGCNRWMHATGCAIFIKATNWHWHYQCNCGAQHKWFLDGMCPMYDDGTHNWPQ